MSKSSIVFRAGTRSSELALIQTRNALDRISGLVPSVSFEAVPMSSPGDRDQKTDLRDTPGNFFTSDLDNALLAGDIDCGIHSAKDMPETDVEGVDWVWLPWHEDPRDVIVMAKGSTMQDLPASPRIGISSERREAYCRQKIPDAQHLPIRGNIGERLAQLDDGKFDLIVTAAAALNRLGLQERTTEAIPLSELPSPDGQGWLAMTFRADDKRFLRLRSTFVKSVAFVGAGIGNEGNFTQAGVEALATCDVCLSDKLLPREVLKHVGPDAELIDVGKRSGNHGASQSTITDMIAMHARRGRKVVRLKGGDPCIFGRLAEEVEAMDKLRLPYRIVPGITSLNVASAESGILLTRRGLSQGFCVMTPREAGGGIADVAGKARADLPIVYYMAISAAAKVVEQLLADDLAPDTPCAVIYDAGANSQQIFRAPLSDIISTMPDRSASNSPGLFIVGNTSAYSFDRTHGALANSRVLLTCSDALLHKASTAVTDLGGIPIRHPLVKLEAVADARDVISDMSEFDWIVITSPSAARCLIAEAVASGICIRSIPKIMVTGPGTARVFEKQGIRVNAIPSEGYSAASVIELAGDVIAKDARVLRLRSDRAGPDLSEAIAALGPNVHDRVLYENTPVRGDALPAFDAVFFASSSAADSFIDAYGSDALEGRPIVVMGQPTASTLKNHHVTEVIYPSESTAPAVLQALAGAVVSDALEKM